MKSRIYLPIALSAFMLVPVAAGARRVIGDDAAEKDDDKDDDKSERKKRKTPEERKKEREDRQKAREEERAEKKRKKAEAAARKREKAEAEREAKEAAAEAAEEAAEAAAEEAERKAEEAKARKLEEKRRKVEERKAANAQAKLKQAKIQRTLTRLDGSTRVVASLRPGAPKAAALLEIRVDIAEVLQTAHPKYGRLKPMSRKAIKAKVTGAGMDAVYRVHPLSAAGAYGFHMTPPQAGKYTVIVSGDGFAVELPLHVGVWPPPDFDLEEQKNLSSLAAASGRRVLK